MRLRGLAVTALTIGVLVTVLLIGSGWLLGTTAGMRWLASSVPGLQAEITDGTLLRGIRAANVAWRDDTQSVEVRDLVAEWDARCFLQRHWCLSTLRAGSINVVLPTSDAAADKTDPIKLPRVFIPFKVSVDAGSVGPIVVAADALQVALDGLETRLQVDDSIVQLDDLRINHASGRATVHGRVELVGDYPLDVTIRAEFREPFRAQQVALDASLLGSIADLEVTAALRSDDGDVMVNGTVQPIAATPRYAVRLTSTRFDWPVDPTYRIALHGSRIDLDGSGDRFRVSAETRLDAEPLRDARLQLQARGNRDALQIRNLSVRSAVVDAHTTGQLSLSPTIAWLGDTVIEKFDVARWAEQIQQPIRGRATVATRLVDELWRVDLDRLHVESNVAAQPLLIEGQLSGFSDGRWEAPELTVASGDNRAEISGNGRYDAEQTTASYRVDVTWDELSWPPGPDAQLQTHDGRLRIVGKNDDFNLTGDALLAGMQLPIARARFDVEGNRAQIDLQALNVETLGGALTAQGSVRLDATLGWQARAEFANIDPARHWPELAGKLRGRVVADGFLAAERLAVAIRDLAIQGEFRGAAIDAQAQGYADGTGLLRLDTLALRSDENRLSLQGTRLDSWALRGEADLSDIAKLVPRVGGSAKGTFRIDGALDRPDVTLDVHGRDLSIDDTRAGEVRLTGTVRALGYADSEFIANLGTLQGEGFAVNTVALKALGTRANHSIDVQLDGEPVAFSAAVRGALAETTDWQGTVSAARVQAPGGHWELTKPLALEWLHATRTVQLPAHCWRQSDATLCLTQRTAVGETGDVALRLKDFDVARLDALLPQGTALAGLLRADGRARWAAGESPALKLTGVLQDGQVTRALTPAEDSVRYRFRELAVQAELDAGQLTADVHLDAQDMGKVSARLAVRPIQAPWPLDGQLSLRGLNLATLAAFFPQLTTLQGIVDAEGSLGGDLQRPVFTGQVTASAVAVAAQELPLTLQDGEIEVEVRGTRASFTARARVGEGGDLQVRGDAEWSAASWAVTLDVQGQDVTVRHTLFEARASPNLALALEPGKVKLSGEIDVPWARVTLRELPPDVTRVSRDVVIVDADSPLADDDWRIETHIRVKLGSDVRFEGLGLRAKLSGDVQIDQVEAQPVSATGEIVIDEGEYSAYGQKLKVTEGRLLFVGSLQPDVTLTAVREVGEVTAGLELRGTLERPQTTLFANPPQTETNTLSYIVLGRPIDAGNREDGAVLTQAALALGLAGGGRGLATQVAEQFGIQDFEIETQDDPTTGTQVVLRGRLSPNLTVRYGVGVLTPHSVLTLRYDLTERLYVEVAEGIENALDFFYSISF